VLGRGRGGSVSLVGGENVEAAPEAPPPPLRAKLVTANGNGGNGGFEADLVKVADKLRGNMEPSDYKHVALGLIFLKHISDSFEAKRSELLADYPDGAEDRDEYAADNVFWVPRTARWSHLRANAKQPSIGKMSWTVSPSKRRKREASLVSRKDFATMLSDQRGGKEAGQRQVDRSPRRQCRHEARARVCDFLDAAFAFGELLLA
jgi:hypothetical protein